MILSKPILSLLNLGTITVTTTSLSPITISNGSTSYTLVPVGLQVLPSDYLEVDYIYTNSNSRIVTTYSAANVWIESKWYMTGGYSSSAGNCALFSGQSSGWTFSMASWGSYWYSGSENGKFSGPMYNTDIIVKYNVNNSSIYINNSLVYSSVTCHSIDSLDLFHRAVNDIYGYGKLFYFKVYNVSDNLLVGDFYPCYKKDTNTAGVYELITLQFYPGTAGTIYKGNDVSRINPVVFNINKFGTWNITQDGVTKTVTANKLDLNLSF